VAVYAVSTVDGESAQGTSTSTTVNAYGPPVSPSMSCGAGGTAITCSWSGGNANGRPTSFVVSGDWSSADGGASGSHPFGDVGYSATRTLCIKAVQQGGAEGTNNCQSATTLPAPPPPPPSPSVGVSKGASMRSYTNPPGICTTASCAYITVTTANFGGNVDCTVYGDGGYLTRVTMGPNETRQTVAFWGFPGKTVSATCGTASGSLIW